MISEFIPWVSGNSLSTTGRYSYKAFFFLSVYDKQRYLCNSLCDKCQLCIIIHMTFEVMNRDRQFTGGITRHHSCGPLSSPAQQIIQQLLTWMTEVTFYCLFVVYGKCGIGHIILTHGHLFKGKGAPKCPFYSTSNFLIKHILLACPIFIVLRQCFL